MFFTHIILTSLTVVTAVANQKFKTLNSNVFGKRQEYQPTITTCGIGETCEEACGPGYLECGETLCYNPEILDVCCGPDWLCVDNDYCLVDPWCCPRGIDPNECANSFGVTLPADFVGPTATPSFSNVTSAVITATSRPSSRPSSVPEFTGAASPNTVAGGSGLLYTFLLVVGNLF